MPKSSWVTHMIDQYSVYVFAEDLRSEYTKRLACKMHLFSGGDHVGGAYFVREGHTIPESSCSENKIYYYAPAEQYERVLDLLRNEAPVGLTWVPASDTSEPAVYFFTEREPVGEEEK